MTERPLMTADELKSMKKGSFIVMKTGAHLCDSASDGQTMADPVEAKPEQELNHIAEQAKTAKPLRTG